MSLDGFAGEYYDDDGGDDISDYAYKSEDNEEHPMDSYQTDEDAL